MAVERTSELLEDAGEGEYSRGARRRVIEGPVLARPLTIEAVQRRILPGLPAYADVASVAMRVAALATNPSVRLRTGPWLGVCPRPGGGRRDWIDGTHPRSPSTNAEGGQ